MSASDPQPGATPYADLTPDAVLDTLEALGLHPDGRLMALNSYENRVFQVGLDSGEFVVAKFYRPGRWQDAQILEEHAFAHALEAAEIPVVPPLPLTACAADAEVLGPRASLGCWHGHRVAVAPRRGGRPAELDDPEVLRWLGRFLARMHVVGAEATFQHRLRLTPKNHGIAARDWLAEQDHVLPPGQRQAWLQAADAALSRAEGAFARLPQTETVRLHGDMHPGNLLWTPEGPHFVDLDDACMGPPVQDLWMLLSGDAQERRPQLDALMDGYETLREFDWRTLALIEPLRTVRIVHHSAWLARRWDDPAFPAAFPWFGTDAYWAEQCALLQQQTELMDAQQAQPWGLG